MFTRCLLIAALLAATALSAPARRELAARRAARPAPRRLSADDDPSPEPSPFFGREGELWKPDGPFMDFSYAGGRAGGLRRRRAQPTAGQPPANRPARPVPLPPSCTGYRNSDEDIPRPPVTRDLWDFKGEGRSESGALRAMVEWANDRPESEGAALPGGRRRAPPSPLLHPARAVTAPSCQAGLAGLPALASPACLLCPPPSLASPPCRRLHRAVAACRPDRPSRPPRHQALPDRAEGRRQGAHHAGHLQEPAPGAGCARASQGGRQGERGPPAACCAALLVPWRCCSAAPCARSARRPCSPAPRGTPPSSPQAAATMSGAAPG